MSSDSGFLDRLSMELSGKGTKLLVGTIVDYSGVFRGKGVPIARLRAFHEAGMGTSPLMVVYCVDNLIAFTETLGVTGDVRLRIDASRIRDIGDGMAWGPVNLCDQNGNQTALCPRSLLQNVVARAIAAGLVPTMGTELEFTLTPATGGGSASMPWAAYGMRALTEKRRFIVDLTESLVDAGLAPEQIHAEFGEDQFEVSLPPADPVTMADDSVLARIVIGAVAARHDLEVSFSPMPRVGGSGNGAHLHLSLTRDGQNIFGGGDGPHGQCAEGSSAIAGVLETLPELLGVYAGSAVSGNRLQPGAWSGAWACWGLENREAAIRFMAGTRGNPHGANIELKVVDPSANMYLAAAAMLGSALFGIENSVTARDEVSGDPAGHIVPQKPLDFEQKKVIDALAGSDFAAKLFGSEIVTGLVAVRRHEIEAFAGLSPVELADSLRLAWS